MAKKILMAVCTVLTVPTVLFAGPWNWKKTAGGEYSFEDPANWESVGSYATYNIINAQTEGKQTITVGEPHDDIGNFYVGGAPCPLLFKGESLLVTSYLSFKFGETIVENSIDWNTTDRSALIGSAADSTLRLQNGGTLTLHGDKAFSVGNAGYPGSLILEKDGTLNLPDGGTVKLGSTATEGSTGRLLVKEGGTYAGSGNHRLMVGGQTDGYVRQDGGQVDIGTRGLLFNTDDGTKAPAGSTYGLYHFAGGTLTSTGPARIGNNFGSADLYVEADGMTVGSVYLGEWGAVATAARTAALTVDKGATLETTGDWTVGSAKTGDGEAISVNLNDGGTVRIAAGKKLSETDGTAATVNFNFNGGRIESRGQVYMQAYEHFQYVVYPKGGTLALRENGACNVSGEIVDATGYGVDSISLTAAGSNYVSAPKVVISGGSGTGAQAIAVMGEDRAVKGVVVTCRGSGYAADDVLTVSFVSPLGSGAAAEAKLSVNTPGVFTIDCEEGKTVKQWQDNHYAGILNMAGGEWIQAAALPNLGELRLSGGSFNGAKLNSEVTLKSCAGDSTHLAPTFKVPSGSSGNTTEQKVAALDLEDGVVTLGMVDNKGNAKFSAGTYTRERGIALVSAHARFLANVGETDFASTGVDGTRQLNGMIWNAGETLSPVVIGDDGALSKGDTKNVSSAAAEGESVISERKTVTLKYSTVNSLTMNAADGLSEVLFGANGQSEILSGMVLFRYSGTNALKRIAATSGSITTRNPGGLVLFANGVCERELALGGESNHLKVEGPFADPDGGTPLAMTFASRRQGSPDRGALYWLSSTANTFSGGVNLNDGAVAIASDASLGAAAAPVHVSGDSLLMSAEGPLILPATRTIELADKARFVLRSASEGNAAQVAATVKGTGDLYVNKFDSTMAMKLTGDVSGFTGDYYISGTLEAASLPEKSGIRFAGDTVPGVLETNGVFDRDLTTKEGGIAWIGAACYGADKAFGGLAAKGGDLAVDFGGAGETVNVGCEALPDGARVALQSADADGELAISNRIDLCGHVLSIAVAAGKEATLACGICDSVGGGVLDLSGEGVLAVAGTLPAGLTVTGNGILRLTGSIPFAPDEQGEVSSVQVEGAVVLDSQFGLDSLLTREELEAYRERAGGILLLTAKGGISGARLLNTPYRGWKLRAKAGELRLTPHADGTVIVIR